MDARNAQDVDLASSAVPRALRRSCGNCQALA